MRKSKMTVKHDAPASGARWVVLLFIGIAVGGTTLALDRILDLGKSPFVQAGVGVSIIIVLISFLGFMSRFRD